ncbi:MAG: cytochrome c biogenesis protein ResB, partial [Phycisphaerales bacterium]|nr:cytochrome c biogenesis protein ResB [Phycisphaerales bacterium]
FKSALVAAGGLTENPSGGGDNPAIDVVISDGKGTSERHTVFEKFPDMVLKRTLEGTAVSGAELRHGAGPGGGEELVLFGEDGALRAAHVSASGDVSEFEHGGSMPWVIEAGGRMVRVLDSRTHARQATRFVEAPPADEFRPAIVVRINGGEPTPLAWKSSLAVPGVPGSDAFLRLGPRRIQLPFKVELEAFRKTDYPGTMMAMAYESDVVINSDRHTDERMTIYMNNPFAYDAWKVYQSGYLGDNISIFSVMRDPGLPMTYFGCIVLCVGILVVFYWRAFSRGHPGIGRPQMPSPKRETSPNPEGELS